MASGGKSSGSSDSFSALASVLGGIAQKINKEVDPVRKLFLSQMQQVLSGNMFTNSTLPLIQSGVSAARQAGAASLSDTQSQLAQEGVSQSPFAASLMSLIKSGTNEAIGRVPGDVSRSMLGEIGSYTGAVGGQALSGLSNAAQINRHTNTSGSSFNWQDPFSLWMQS
jgi:hypothetical protein